MLLYICMCGRLRNNLLLQILTVTVHDEDETNNFQFKVLENSGFGADKFTMVRNNDGTGSLKIVQPLDYEDPQQSQGFHFRIQVNDKGVRSLCTSSLMLPEMGRRRTYTSRMLIILLTQRAKTLLLSRRRINIRVGGSTLSNVK